MNKYRYLFENVVVFGLGNIVSKIGSFLLLALYTSHLSAAEFGDAELLVTTVSLLIPVFTLCVSDSVLRFLIGAKNDTHIISNGFLINGLAFLVLLCTYPLFRIIGGPIGNYFVLLVLLFFSDSLEQLLFSIDKGREKVKLCALNSLVSILTLALCSFVFLVRLQIGLYGYLYSLIIAHLICSLYLFFGGCLFRDIPKFKIDKQVLRQMLVYSIPFVPSVIAWWINSASDRYLIVYFLGNEQNGFFSAAAKIPSIVTIITTIFFQAWQISGIKEYQSQKEEYSHFYSTVYNLFSSFLVILSSLLVLATPLIGHYLLKGDFGESWIYVPFLIVAAFYSGLSSILSPAYQAANMTKVLMVSTIVGAVVNIVLNLAFLKVFGLQVATISMAISFFIVWIIRLRLIKKHVDLHLDNSLMIISMILVIAESVVLIYRDSIGMLPVYLITAVLLAINIKWLAPNMKILFARLKSGF